MNLEEIPVAKVVTPPRIDYEKEGLDFFEGIVFKTWKDGACRMDIVCPKGRDEAYPAVIWVHGGGWSDENLNRKYLPSRELADLAKRGYVTASIDYRLCQESPFPAQIEDCKAAVRFLRAHASEYQIDPKRMAAWGESAGGHLVELMAYSDDSEFMDGTNPEFSSRLQGVIPWYAPDDLRMGEEEADKDPWRGLFAYENRKIRRSMMEAASPILYGNRKNPPTLLMHGDKDRLVSWECSRNMYEALKSAGNVVELVTVPGQGHGFFDGEEYYQKIYEFLDRVLRL